MWKDSKVDFAGLVIITTLVGGLLGLSVLAASGAESDTQAAVHEPSDVLDAFITDRVVEVRIAMNEEDWTNCQLNALEEQYVLAAFWFDGEIVPDVAVRPKGVSSLQFVVPSENPRLSLKVDFNLFNSVRAFRGLKKLNFHNGFRDPTLIRECLAYELFAQMDIPAPRVSLVDLWVNDTHLGLYTQVEQVDKTFLRRYFNRDDGNLYKPIMPASFLDWTEEDLEQQRTDFAAILKGDHLDMMRLRTNERFPDNTALFHFLDVLNNEPDETFPTEIEKVLDVDETLRFLAVSTIIVHLDSYLGRGGNYYLYEVDGKFTIIPWDLNETFGTYKCGMPRSNIINLYIDEPTCGPLSERPLIKRLLSHQPYLDNYHGYLESLLNEPFEVDRMEAHIDEVADLVRPFVEADELKFFPTSHFELNLTQDIGRFIGLKAFVVERSESVRQQLEGKQPSAGDGSGNGGNPKKG
jgi:spore coat protein H